MKGVFVTGTDTSVGKTHVTAALARSAVRRGWRVAAIKPVESGCLGTGRELIAADADAIAGAAGGWQAQEERCFHRFEAALAPGVAAHTEGTSISVPDLKQRVQRVGRDCDLVLVEGAGGLLVPLTPQASMADLAIALGFPMVVVARASLGTINHTLLTIEAIERRGMTVTAVVISKLPGDDAGVTAQNRAEIAKRIGPPVLVLQGDLDAEPILDAIAEGQAARQVP